MNATQFAIDYSGLLNNFVIPTLAAMLMSAVGAGLIWLQRKVNDFFKSRGLADKAVIDDSARTAIMTAMENGAQAAIARAQMAAPSEKIVVSNKLIADTVNHVMSSVPDKLDHFGVTQARLNTIATAAVNKALGPA